MKTLSITIIVVILAAQVSACVGRNRAAQGQLENSTWVLTSLDNNQPIEGKQLTIQFENGQVSGKAGCNSYGGSYTIKADEISFGAIFSTEMACLEPAGLMQQEQAYLDLLRAASRFEASEGELRIFVGADPLLIFEKKVDSPAAVAATRLPSSTLPPAATSTSPFIDPTPSQITEPPAGYKEYRDSIAGISIYIPETWVVTGVIGGQYAIFQSYPEDKYVGGESRDPGDSKCDLNIHPAGSTAAGIIQQWKSASRTSIISEEELTLDSGLLGQQLLLESMGRSAALVTEINNRAVTLTCFGNLAPFAGIANTLNEFEPAPSSPIYESPEGFRHYSDTETEVTLDLPASWIVSGIVPGQRAVIQSYPEDKYIGGEAFEPGDTKCDLFIRSDTSVGEFLGQMKANEAITIIAEEQITLDSGQSATSVEIESMGLSDLVVTEIKAYTIVLTCYGDFTPVDAIAVTLRASD